MEKGAHPLDERYIEAYAIHADDRSHGGKGARPTLRCPLCWGMLDPSSRSRGGHRYFAHRESADEQRCPLTTPSYQPAGMSVGCARDPLIEREHRSHFMDHWQRHFRIARWIAPMLTLEKFAGLIEYADVMNLWSYPVLVQRDLPYVLLVMAGFLASRGEDGEPIRVRFWFDGSVRDVGDLWHEYRLQEAEIFRIVYRDPLHSPFPTASHILYWEPVQRVVRLADIRAPQLPRGQVQAFDHFLERHDAERRRRRSAAEGENE